MVDEGLTEADTVACRTTEELDVSEVAVDAGHEQLFLPAIPLAYAQGTPNVSIARPYRFRGIAGGARVELRPFALGSEASESSAAGAGESVLDGGLFARVPVSDALTLSGTWRADFSEVEVDEAQLNLTRFPLFLPEKRDFFLEGAGTFVRR